MKNLILRTTLASSLLFGGATALADQGNTTDEAHEACSHKKGKKNLTPEQRAAWKAKRAERREAFKNMTHEEREAFREQRKARREARLAKMTPEQRAKFEARRANREAKRDARREERRGI